MRTFEQDWKVFEAKILKQLSDEAYQRNIARNTRSSYARAELQGKENNS